MDEEAVAVIGSPFSNSALATIPRVDRDEIPYISLTPADEQVDPIHPYVFVVPTLRHLCRRSPCPRRSPADRAARPAVTPGSALATPAAAANVEGVLPDGSAYVMDVPANWNGTVLLYSHGYVPDGAPNPPATRPATRSGRRGRVRI